MVLTGCPLCLRRLTSPKQTTLIPFPPQAKTSYRFVASPPRKICELFWSPIDASTLGLRLDNRISPICGSSPPGPPRPVCARMAALPIPPFSKWGHGLLIPARLSSRTHIGRTQWTYSITGLSPARTNAPPDALVPTYNRFKTSLKLREVFIIASLFLCFFITELTLTQEPC